MSYVPQDISIATSSELYDRIYDVRRSVGAAADR